MGHDSPRRGRTVNNKFPEAIEALAPPVASGPSKTSTSKAPRDVAGHRGLPTDQLRPAELHALAQLAKKAKDVRDALKPGSTKVDFTVRIRGALKVGADQDSTTNEKPNLEEVLAVVLGSLTPKARTAAVEKVVELIKGKTDVELPPEWIGFVGAVVKQLTREVPQHKRGNVTGRDLVAEVQIRS